MGNMVQLTINLLSPTVERSMFFFLPLVPAICREICIQHPLAFFSIITPFLFFIYLIHKVSQKRTLPIGKNSAFSMVLICYTGAFLCTTLLLICCWGFWEVASDQGQRKYSILDPLFDPFIWLFALPITLGCATLALPLVFYCLRECNLKAAIPVLIGAAILANLLGSPGFFITGIPLNMLFIGLALMYCKHSTSQFFRIHVPESAITMLEGKDKDLGT